MKRPSVVKGRFAYRGASFRRQPRFWGRGGLKPRGLGASSPGVGECAPNPRAIRFKNRSPQGRHRDSERAEVSPLRGSAVARIPKPKGSRPWANVFRPYETGQTPNTHTQIVTTWRRVRLAALAAYATLHYYRRMSPHGEWLSGPLMSCGLLTRHTRLCGTG